MDQGVSDVGLTDGSHKSHETYGNSPSRVGVWGPSNRILCCWHWILTL